MSLSYSYSKVGVAPGTTTLTLGSGGVPRYTQQDPGVTVRNAYGQLMDASLGGRGLGPCGRGLGPGPGPCCGPCAGLGEEVATVTTGDASPEEIAEFARVLRKLELEHKEHSIREIKSRRFWGSIIGIAAGTGAVLGVLNYMRNR